MTSFLLNRDVQIQISNKTKNMTLNNPRVHFHHGYSSSPPHPSVPPGHEESCQFTNSSVAGCEGILTYEADTFTMAIYFCNPLHNYLYSIVLGLEISLEKSHLQVQPVDIFTQMENGRWATYRVSASNRVILSESQNFVQVCAGHVRVTATMSNDYKAIISVMVEDRESSGKQVPGK